ncbi:MAG: hypothetical protein GJ676_15820 [Rhodobacteraceae bacterium]|nr:hypothetical protein [Paracoccaceae bacterium]
MPTFNGTSFDNVIHGSPDADAINGFGGNDTLFGKAGNDHIFAGSGNDSLHAGDGNDELFGGSGDDRLVFSGTGHNKAFGGLGTDVVVIDLSSLSTSVSLSECSWLEPCDLKTSDGSFSLTMNNIEGVIIRAGAGNDSFGGTSGRDILRGGAGNDVLDAGALGGRDQVYGGAGHDDMNGAGRNTQLFGGTGNDRMYLGYEANVGPANGILDGGAGHDALRMWIWNKTDKHLNFVSGGTTVQADGLTIRNVETLDLSTGNGNDTLSLTPKSHGLYSWQAYGGTDHATLDLSQVAGRATFSYQTVSGEGSWAAGSRDFTIKLIGIEQLTITGNAQSNLFQGGNFANTFRGAAGNDTLIGNRQDDQLFGDDGQDKLRGDYGNDLLSGGRDADRLAGQAGDDRLLGGDGNDQLFGGKDRDTLKGDAGNDTLNGGRGRDLLDGGTGTDGLTGGLGRDLFIFRDGDGTDRIHDFELGRDRIDLRRSTFEANDLIFIQKTGYTEVTFAGDTSADGTTIEVVNVTVAQLDHAANFLF